MPAPPARSSLFPSGSLSPATAKSLWADFYDYVAGLLGASGSASAARIALQLDAVRADIASAATLDLDATTTHSLRVTGTVATGAITLADGATRYLVADGAWPISHGVGLICPGAASYICAAGDVVLARGEPAGVVRLSIWKADGTPVTSVSLGSITPLINGGFSINQRAAASNADDTYSHDRWYVLTQAGAIAVSTLTDQENTTPFMARLTQSQASAQRMGYAQIIEGKNCKHMRGQQVTFRFGRERLSASANIRIAVLEWTGTEDAVTSDVVNDWTSGVYTAGNFFLGSNLTVSGVVQQALTANTLTDGSSVTVTLGSSFNNLIVFAWTEAAAAQNVTLDLGKAQLEKAATASAFVAPDYASELDRCWRYYYKVGGVANTSYGSAYGVDGTRTYGNIPFPCKMRTPPSTLEQSGTATDYGFHTGTTATTCSAVPQYQSFGTDVGAGILFTYASGISAGQGGAMRFLTSNAYLGWSAEL